MAKKAASGSRKAGKTGKATKKAKASRSTRSTRGSKTSADGTSKPVTTPSPPDGPGADALRIRAALLKRMAGKPVLARVLEKLSDDEVLALDAELKAATAAAADPSRSLSHARAGEGLKDGKQRAFLTAFVINGGIVGKAALAAGINRRTHVGWLHKDEAYKEAWEEAQELAADVVEGEASRRAIEGLVSYKFNKFGEPLVHPLTGAPYYELVYSDALLVKLLEARRPQLYRRKQLEVTGPNGAPLGGHRVDLKKLDDKELALYEALVKKMSGEDGK